MVYYRCKQYWREIYKDIKIIVYVIDMLFSNKIVGENY